MVVGLLTSLAHARARVRRFASREPCASSTTPTRTRSVRVAALRRSRAAAARTDLTLLHGRHLRGLRRLHASLHQRRAVRGPPGVRWPAGAACARAALTRSARPSRAQPRTPHDPRDIRVLGTRLGALFAARLLPRLTARPQAFLSDIRETQMCQYEAVVRWRAPLRAPCSNLLCFRFWHAVTLTRRVHVQVATPVLCGFSQFPVVNSPAARQYEAVRGADRRSAQHADTRTRLQQPQAEIPVNDGSEDWMLQLSQAGGRARAASPRCL